MQYSLVKSGQAETVIVLIDGDLVPVSHRHANYARIKTYLTATTPAGSGNCSTPAPTSPPGSKYCPIASNSLAST